MRRGRRRPIAALAAFALLAGAPQGRAGGVSEAEYLRVTPPMPHGLRVEAGPGGSAIVSWAAPAPPPGGAVAYDRRLSHYRVYRGPVGAERLIGETRDRRFVDPSPPRSGAGYVVTAVHGEGQESGRPDAVALSR